MREAVDAAVGVPGYWDAHRTLSELQVGDNLAGQGLCAHDRHAPAPPLGYVGAEDSPPWAAHAQGGL